MKKCQRGWTIASALLFAILLLSGCETIPVSEKRARAIKAEEIVGEWGGFSDDSVFHLMKLQLDGSGIFGYLPYRGEPIVLRIRQWQCKEKRLVVLLAPIYRNPDGIQKVEGSAGWLNMHLTVWSDSSGDRQVVFHREDDRAQRWNLLKARMATCEAKVSSPQPGDK